MCFSGPLLELHDSLVERVLSETPHDGRGEMYSGRPRAHSCRLWKVPEASSIPWNASFLKGIRMYSGVTPLLFDPRQDIQRSALQRGTIHHALSAKVKLRARQLEYIALPGKFPRTTVFWRGTFAFQVWMGSQSRCTMRQSTSGRC